MNAEHRSGPTGHAPDTSGERPRDLDPTSLVEDLLFGIERAEIDLPHTVLSRNALTGEASYSGPYASGLTALSAAEAEHTLEVQGGGDGQITFQVAALYPPLEPVRRPSS
jgi:hypothetical protein